MAKFFKEQQKQGEEAGIARAVGLAMLFPGNFIRSALASNSTEAPDVHDVWRQGFELATKKTGWWTSLKVQEVMLAGSWCCIFGSLVSLLSGRTHFLALLGVGLCGYAIVMNELTPTLQFGIAAAAVLSGVAQRPGPAARARPEATDTSSAEGDAGVESRKDK